MADRMAAEIWIGGSIPESLVEELCAQIRGAGVFVDWDETPFEPHTAQELSDTAAENDGLLPLCDHEATAGVFEDLEAWLQKNRIPFTRKSDGKYEYDPVIVEFRPEEGWREWVANKALEPVVTVEALEEAKGRLQEAATCLQGQKWEAGRELTDAALNALQAALPPELPPLPPLATGLPRADTGG